MVANRKHYQSGLEAAVAERAETIGLARECKGFYEYAGYTEVYNDDKSKHLYLITVRDENGIMGNLVTKSENVAAQLDSIMETVGDVSRKLWKIGFSEQKTKTGNNVIIVNMTLADVPVLTSEEVLDDQAE